MAVAFALLTAMTIATYSVVDWVASGHRAIRLSYIAWLFILEGLVFFIMWSRGRNAQAIQPQADHHWSGGRCAGGIGLWACSLCQNNGTLGHGLRCVKPRLFSQP